MTPHEWLQLLDLTTAYVVGLADAPMTGYMAVIGVGVFGYVFLSLQARRVK